MPINSSTTLIVTTCPICELFYSYNNISMSNFWTMSMWFALWLTNHTYQWLNPQMYHNFFSISYALKKPSKFVAIIAHWNNIFFIPIFKNFLIAWGWAKLIITRRRTTTKTWRRHPLCWGENGKKKNFGNSSFLYNHVDNICINITSYPLHSLHLNSTFLKLNFNLIILHTHKP